MDHPQLRAVAHDAMPLRLVTGLDRLTAFGRAVGHLMTRPAFAAAPFGNIARALAGQVNRGHYGFVQSDELIVGFAGWALVDELKAEAWLRGEHGFSSAEGEQGDCVVLNFWQADTPAVSRFLVARLTEVFPDKRRLYAKRHYPEGRVRPLRLDLSVRAGHPEQLLTASG